jgi:hypothetical protein
LLGRWKSWRLGFRPPCGGLWPRDAAGYSAIGAELAKAGHANEYGRPFLHKRVRAMLDD